MVIGYNPSHSNINSEVNAPFKILSTLLRFIDNETKGLNQNNTKGQKYFDLGEYDDQEESKNNGKSGLQNYKMARVEQIYGGGQNERLDTVEGQFDLYDKEDDKSDNSGDEDFNNMKDD